MIEGMFADWSTKTLADQCHMQAREQLDPEFTQLMTAVGNRLAALDIRAGDAGEGFGKFTLHELGRQDFERGEPRGAAWPERAAGWDAAYGESLEKAAGGLRRIHAGRYESEDGYWSIVETGRGQWSLLEGYAPGCRTRTETMIYPTFAAAMQGLREEAALSATPAPAVDAVPAGEVRLRMFLDILSAAGGTSDCSEWPGAWTNAFCETHEGQSPDTFNTAIDKGYTWSTYDADRDHGTVTLTAAGRAYLAALSHGEGLK